ncbi:ABC transporter permease [Rathayibacter sp. VKM Ac-2927]|uniref:ABC transporter permease n=1 Tax=Rathayibacter sp. VKM Ac-2927 TaxID=2929478 RepID=UPI001FB53814|nr:FtsX-like permease family protein [Rathayibacter sp. VKM Ac-2927]MCJ1687479.1 lipoprotein ABC transporter permease [Rathayibacter sp. VKM Ac-2927]
MKRRFVLPVLREALASSLAQPVTSLLTLVMVVAMCAGIVLTTGRTVGAEQSVLATVDSAGTRSILVRGEAQAGLSSDALERISRLSGVQWAAAFSDASDVGNSRIAEGRKVALRSVWSSDFAELGIESARFPRGSAWASEDALAALGFAEETGSVSTGSGAGVDVVGTFTSSEYLSFLGPSVLVPMPPSSTGSVGYVIVIASDPEMIRPLTRAIGSLLAPTDPQGVTVTTSARYADLRAVLEGTLGGFGRDLVGLIAGAGAVLVGATQYGLVLMRRKDFGRRRALGATRGLIVLLVVCQVLLVATVGALLGTAGSAVLLVAGGDPLPGVDFLVATGALAIVVSVVAALLPAQRAASRDPLHELRVP